MKYPAAIRQSFEQATSYFGQGQHAQAVALCQHVLSRYPNHCDALHLLGVVSLRTGRPTDALNYLQRAAELNPEQGEVHTNLGNAQLEAGEHVAAIASFDRALSLQPGNASSWNNRGHALLLLSRPDEALASFERALAVQPEYVRALNNKGTALLRLQRPEDALEPLQQAVTLAPEYAEALCNLGMVLSTLKRNDAALPFLNRALELKPNFVAALLARADLLHEQRRTELALIDYRRAIVFEPHNPRALSNAGNALLALGRADEALACYDACLKIAPGSPEALSNRGNALTRLLRFEEALAYFDQALTVEPNFANALNNRAGLLSMLGRIDETHQCLEQLYRIDPMYPYAQGYVQHFRLQKCDWREYEVLHQQILARVTQGNLVDVPFQFLSVSGSPELQLRCSQIYVQDQCTEAPPRRAAKPRTERIRLAYVSGDLRSHAVSYLMSGVFREHDRTRFEVTALALQPPDDSNFARQLQASFDRFLVVQHLQDHQIAQAIRELNIDIAIDLMGHTQYSRPGIFVQRPAPVQIQHLGFPGTMGTAFIDYLIGDEYLMPQAEHIHYQEQLILLPHCFQSNDDQREIAPEIPTRSEVGLPESAFVFCSFNNSFKINPDCFATWMRLLRLVPDSVLWLVANSEVTRTNLQEAAVAHGIHRDRLIFAPRMSYAQHLARLTLADLFLDTLPFNAGATASDALWAGVPMLTCPGRTYAARMAGSLLNALNMNEMIADNWHDYEARALELANDREKLAQLRNKLARQRLTQPLFNTKQHTRHLERAYEMALDRAVRGEAPSTFRVPAEH